jgi:hypothetical protein
MDDVREVIHDFLVAGIVLVVVPGHSVALAFLLAFTPRPIAEFFRKPGFWNKDDEEEEEADQQQ